MMEGVENKGDINFSKLVTVKDRISFCGNECAGRAEWWGRKR
jgi:hypothetical protein